MPPCHALVQMIVILGVTFGMYEYGVITLEWGGFEPIFRPPDIEIVWVNTRLQGYGVKLAI